jgi:protein-S-isoprenylcysteine O-methyltransferase Ste14
MEKVKKAAAIYFVLQGIGVVAWWVLLIAVPESRLVFVLEGNRETSLLAFWLADAVFIAAGSLAAAMLIRKRSKFAVAALWLVTGAVSYATLYTFAFVMISDRGWAGVVMMVPAMIWSGVFATALTVENDMFREARATSTNYILLKTFTQIAVVWSLILAVIPYVITMVETKIGIPTLELPYRQLLASVFFVAISSLGVWSAIVMSRIGKGTPLPLDHAPNFVACGPYAFVRNPMAVSGVGQGLAVALFLGSPLVAIYALMGSAIWQLIFRPLEEDDLDTRFGAAYLKYKAAVKCWLPRARPYKSAQ